MEADLIGNSERAQTPPNDSLCDSSDTKCDSQFAGAAQINTEMEEGELPSEDCSKPSTPIKYNSALNTNCESQSSKLKLEMGSYARKPVLGKEKAKQRLKALRIQNKLQMESRNNTTPKKQSAKLTSDSNQGGSASSSSKKDRKLLSPLEKAQLTVEEIEVMKREGERPKVPICYHESMIHRITADSLDSSNVSQPTLTPSIEALKAYNDDHFCGEERKRKRAKPEAYRRRRRSAVSPLKSLSSSRRKLKFRREKGRLRDFSRDRVKSGSKISKKERRRSRERPASSAAAVEKSVSRPCSFAIRPGGLVPSIWAQEEHLRFTETRPVISYSVKRQTKQKLKSKVKSRKRSRKKRETIAPPAAVTLADDGADGVAAKPKRKKKRKSKSKSRDRLSSEKKAKKKKSKKSDHPKRQIGGLSFVVDELNFDEELDAFPLSKEGFQPSNDSDDAKPKQQVELGEEEASTPIGKVGIGTPVPDGSDLASVVSNIHESTPEDESPDTDDYMPNWEEEDEDSDKDETILPFFVKDHIEPSNEDAYSSTEESTPESIKDGLSTPIFVNPSPPREMLEQISFPENQPALPQLVKNDSKQQKDSEEEESHTPPPMKPKHLFEMENIYEEFLRSVREDPDFKESLPNELSKQTTPTANTTDEEEFGFLSQTSVSLTPPAVPDKSSPNTSDESSKSDESSDTESSESQSLSSTNDVEDTKKTAKRKCESIGEAAVEFETMLDEAELATISPEDLKKLRSLQKRRGMLKWIRQQIDGMDEEDRLCLLGLEKLMRAERQLLLRNNAIKKLHELKNILGTDSEDSKDGADNETDKLEKTATDKTLQDELTDIGAILDIKRETIKLTITSQCPMKMLPAASSLHGKETVKETCDEDQDFTERLMKPKEKFVESPSRSKNKSPQRSVKPQGRSGRSLSVSPMRRSRKSKGHERTSERSKRRAYSPSPSRAASRRRDGKASSRNRNSGSPPTSNRSRRSCRSPYTPEASPTRSHSSSRSPSRSPLAAKEDMATDQGLVNSYPAWNIDRYSQYYVGDSYYFPNTPAVNTDHKSGGEQPRYPVAYDYAQYNMYANEYMNVGGTNYQPEYGQQSDYSGHHRIPSTGNDDCNPYLSIPVIGSSSVGSPASYFYKDSGFEESQPPIIATNMKCIEIHRQEASNSPKPFAVQKGNVLEIVPATTITAVVKESPVVKKELLDIVIKKEPIDDDDEPTLHNIDDEKIECTAEIKVEMKGSKKNHSWKDEVARRHVVSAVMRLNKETEDSPRGILKSRGNSTIPVRDKKKVLFADGIPPGRSSSASSDEEATLKFIKKRLKKSHRRMQSENKENETSVEASERNHSTHEAKADPELWDAPPPPPPAGSPPPHLPQPILIRPASPEELLYFHFDAVYNMMYVSPMENAIPPRLLQNNGKPTSKPNVEISPVENEETTSELTATGKGSPSPPSQQDNYSSPDGKEESSDAVLSSSIMEKKCTPSPEQSDSPTPPQQAPPDPQCASPPQAPLPPAQQSSPPQKIQNIVSIRMSNSPLLYNQGSVPNVVPAAPAYETAHPPLPHSPKQLHQSPASRTPLPMMINYPGQVFNRMPSRRMSPNVVRSPYSMPPPSPHSRAFNPHIPPPFHQPPPCTNHMSPHSAFESSLPPMPPSSAAQPPAPFNPNMMMFGSQQAQQHAPRPPGFSFNLPPSNQTPHMMMNRPPARFSAISSSVAVPKFLHGSDRNGSPRLGSLLYRHHPSIPQPPLPHQPPPSTPPPTTPYN